MNRRRELSIIIRIAWRTVVKNRRRTILTALSVAVGCGMIIFFRAVQRGGFEQMVDDALSTNTGHIQIHELGWWENRSIEYAFRPDPGRMAALRRHPAVAAVSERIVAGGLLSAGDATMAVMIQAVDPRREPAVTVLHRFVVRGRYLAPADDTAAVLGSDLAQNLGVAPGATVNCLSQGFDGSIAAERLTVVGIVKSQDLELNRSLVLVPLARAAENFAMDGHVSAVVVRLREIDDTAALAAALRRQWGADREVLDWAQMLQELTQMIALKQASALIFFVVLLVIVSAGVMNSMHMSVFERTRELGIMMAIGTSPRQVVAMVLAESLFIVFIGIAGGVLLGTALGAWFHAHPISMARYQDSMAAFNMQANALPTRLTAGNVVSTALVTLVFGVLFSIGPALRAARLRPLEAIRHL